MVPQAGRPELTIRTHELTYLAAVVGMATVGAVLAGRRPHHPVGWLMLGLGLSVTVLGVETVEFPPFYSFRNPFYVPALAGPAVAVWLPAIVLTLLSVVVGGASLVVRFRRGRRGRARLGGGPLPGHRRGDPPLSAVRP